MDDNKTLQKEDKQTKSLIDRLNFRNLYVAIILNWKWFIIAVVFCLGIVYIRLRYTTPVYQVSAKLLIKDDGNNRRGNSIQNTTNLGVISNSTGIDNEMEILSSHTLAESAVRDLKLYVNYVLDGKFKDKLLYRTEPVMVDIDAASLEKINRPISMTLTKTKKGYYVHGTYFVPIDATNSRGPYTFERELTSFPTNIYTRAGVLTFTENLSPEAVDIFGEAKVNITLQSPNDAAYQYQGALSVRQTGNSTTIAQLALTDINIQRGIDYLKQLSICYNRQANNDKNQIAVKTENFINTRLEKINSELGLTEDKLENFKKRNNMVELRLNASQAMNNQDLFSQRLVDANTQIMLLDELTKFIKMPSNKYEPLPADIGISDKSTNLLINKYNEIALERKRLLHTASEASPTITPLTAQLIDINNSIRRAMLQAKKALEIQRNAVTNQFSKYNGQVGNTPEQERILTQIGRQQEVKSGLYLMLLQKREENSISLAATVDKGKLIDEPEFAGKLSPNSSMFYMVALIIGLVVPIVIIYILEFFHYKIEGRNDVIQLTQLPILGDVPIASEQAKTKADIVVHENKNNLMEEIFRGMRTNLQFMMEDGEKVVAFTSTTSGEGKTFMAANLAVSFALLGKRVIILGLDIRKPRLAELFEIHDHHHGITNLLVHSHSTMEDIQKQILPSDVNKNLDLLMAGPTPPNPTELLARESLDDIVAQLKTIYDYIIIDTAPVGLVTDTLQIARIVDATVYVCRADYTPKDSFILINSLNEERKLPNMAIVINGLDMTKKKYGYYYGYGKYAKYGKYARYGYYSKGAYGAGGYRSYSSYSSYGSYNSQSNTYISKDDNSIKQ